MTRRILTRAARERCPHDGAELGWTETPPPRPYCPDCGVFYVIDDGDMLSQPVPDDGLDWPATERADREQMEREGQGRLPL